MDFTGGYIFQIALLVGLHFGAMNLTEDMGKDVVNLMGSHCLTGPNIALEEMPSPKKDPKTLVFQIPPEVNGVLSVCFWAPNTASPGVWKPREKERVDECRSPKLGDLVQTQ